MFYVLTPGFLLPRCALKGAGLKKKLEKKLTAPPKLASFYNKHLKSTGAKVSSISTLISDNAVLGELFAKLAIHVLLHFVLACIPAIPALIHALVFACTQAANS